MKTKATAFICKFYFQKVLRNKPQKSLDCLNPRAVRNIRQQKTSGYLNVIAYLSSVFVQLVQFRLLNLQVFTIFVFLHNRFIDKIVPYNDQRHCGETSEKHLKDLGREK